MHMPDMSGMDVLAWLQRRGPGGAPAVAMLSADSDPHTVQQAMTRGAAAYLTKPIVIGRLLALLERLASARQPAEPEAAPVTGHDASDSGAISVTLLRRLVSAAELTRYLQLSDHELVRGLRELVDCGDTPARIAGLHRLKNTFVAIDHAGGRDACTALRQALDADQPTEPALAAIEREVTDARRYLSSQPEFSPG
jgi:response regulator RpfG family c-di-GMP phosphodiesterase